MAKKKINILKKFVVKKYIMAKSASEALRRERKYKADDVWIDEEWLRNQKESPSAIGFSCERSDKDDY